MRIGVDLISGENDLTELVKGCIDALNEEEDIEVVVLGKKEVYEPLFYDRKSVLFRKIKKVGSRLSILDASEVITMEDSPLQAVKQKKDSSIVKGLQAHKDKEIDAFFSPGNTGAIVVAASLIVGRVKGIKKPALATLLPNTTGGVNLLLDVGASAQCDENDLIKFGVMGRIFLREMIGVQNPRVALLNIGSESYKGTPVMQTAYQRLSQMEVNFVGNVEGNAIFSSLADVIVSDGAIGNITLKVAEGASKAVTTILKNVITDHPMAKYALPLYQSALKDLKRTLDPEEYGGAPLLGVRGNVFIGHGISGRRAIKYGVLAAANAVRKDILGKMHRRLEDLKLVDQ